VGASRVTELGVGGKPLDWADSGMDKTRSPGIRLARRLASLRADVAFAVVDAFLVVVAYGAALMIRFFDLPDGVPPQWWEDFSLTLPIIVAAHLTANVALGAYGHVWQFASVAEAVRIVLANVSAAAALLGGLLLFRFVGDGQGPIPIGSLALGSVLTLGLMGAVRFRARLFSLHRIDDKRDGTAKARVLIVGTGRPAVDLARHLAVGNGGIHVVGFVGNVPSGKGRRLADLPVLGPIDAVPDLVRLREITEIIVASKNGAPLVRRLVDLCLSVEVRLRIIPDIDSVLTGGTVQDVRDLEPDDLLERASVHTELDAVAALLSGARVMVTGAGGSIGSELVRQIASFGPARLVALDHDETLLHQAAMTWHDSAVEVETVLCDIRDRSRLLRVFQSHQPQVVFHAAAHKHVPILESNPEEAVKTNILGTMILLEAVRRSGAGRFVLISTDKAANPIGVMGASKRVAEMLMQSETAAPGDTHFSAVRFGNVLGSRGSVVPTFVEQIKSGGPVTVTDKEMTRYFMTTREAVELVLQAAALAGDGQVLVLDMGEPVKIVDLAHRLIRMAGLVPGRDIEVDFIGRRPGERLHEVLSTVPLIPSSHPRISIADQGLTSVPFALNEKLRQLIRLASLGDGAGLREVLMSIAQGEWSPTVDLEHDDLVVDLREEGALTERAAGWSG